MASIKKNVLITILSIAVFVLGIFSFSILVTDEYFISAGHLNGYIEESNAATYLRIAPTSEYQYNLASNDANNAYDINKAFGNGKVKFLYS